MKQFKKLVLFIIAISVFILFLFIIENNKEDTEYSDVFFSKSELAEGRSPTTS